MRMDTLNEKALALLAAMGIEAPESDPLFRFIVDSVTESILNETNQDELPEGLVNLAAEMVAGKYLQALKASGSEKLSAINLDAAVKQIEEGDTSVTFAVGEGSQTPEQRLDDLISRLCDGRRGEIYKYRRLLW